VTQKRAIRDIIGRVRLAIRHATPQDHEAVSKFTHATTLARYEAVAPVTRIKRGAALALTDAATSTLIAEENGALIGLCQLQFSRRPACVSLSLTRPIELARFVIAPERYNDGAADELFIHALHAAWTREARSVWVRVWEHDLECMAFLERHRFRFAGQQDQDTPGLPHDWIMTRAIGV
jgi:N-acetylglutamate synthase-like GNAT family acetyltransferase